MHAAPDAQRFVAAAQRFQTFFSELQGAFVERESLLLQMALALLSREHILVTGSPGTAKSQVTAAVLARIVDENTGKPSLYARQFTESTVQTDIIGPVDFKTLMETGRTEHFTDEGILGAVHAFLDEVFDGRDMLLRSTLNVLQERELKQGTHITKGRIECAVMTTNRYLTEVIETSRETLLAFIDRIAFVNFVPRGFAAPGALAAVLRRHAGRGPSALLEAPLTIQDLDVLQTAVDATQLPDVACDALAELIDGLDRELTGAMRADPEFVPTRFLSTRTAVRSGKVLRAVCVCDKIFGHPERPLVVRRTDFTHLRLHLLLSGPTPEAATVLFERENDPRERRQLSTLRTEREAFERCLAKLPPFDDVTPEVPPPRILLPAASSPAPPTDKLLALTVRARDALAQSEVHSLCALAREISALASTRDAQGESARRLLEDVMRGLSSSVLASTLSPITHWAAALGDTLFELSRVAQSVESVGGSTRVYARRLRGRVLAMTEAAAALNENLSEEALRLISNPHGQGYALMAEAEARLSLMEFVNTRRRALIALGVEAPAGETLASPWLSAVASLEQDLVSLWDAALRARTHSDLSLLPDAHLGAMLNDLSREFTVLSAVESRLGALTESTSDFRSRVISTRICPLVALAFAPNAEQASKRDPVERVRALSKTLSDAGLSDLVSPSAWMKWTAEAFLRAEQIPKIPDISRGCEGFYALRRGELRAPLTVRLIEVALCTGAASPEGEPADFRGLLSTLPGPMRANVGALDLMRIDRSLSYLDRWCDLLCKGAMADVLRSGILGVVRDESTLLKFELEARVIGEALSEHAEASVAARARIEALHARVRSMVNAQVSESADLAWAETLSGRPV